VCDLLVFFLIKIFIYGLGLLLNDEFKMVFMSPAAQEKKKARCVYTAKKNLKKETNV
jgi:hypothetical protein